MPELNESIKTKPSGEPKQMTPKTAKFVDGPGYSSFYINNVAYAVNQLDIVLILGEIIDVSPAMEALIERKARVTMNPAQAKALSAILNHAVALYESQNGPVHDLSLNLPVSPSK
jgi:hypothetical protein